MRKAGFTRIVFVVLLFTAYQSNGQFYYGLHQEFGKNRVERKEFDWRFYRYDRYDVYHYEGGKEIAEQASRMVGRLVVEMENKLNVVFEDRLQVIVFNSLTDLKQSNLNLNDEESLNTGGVIHSSGSRLFVYSDGNYRHMEHQVLEGLAGIALNGLMYGGFTRNLRNSALLNLPEWYTEGLLSYLSHPYDAQIRNWVRDGVVNGSMERINSLSGPMARAAGHSLWEFIAQTYGVEHIRGILYTTVSERSIDRGFEYNLGIDSEILFENWRLYNAQTFLKDRPAAKEGLGELGSAKKEAVIHHPLFSPDGNSIAYTTHYLGKYTVEVRNLATGDKERVIKKGFRINQNLDYSYPLIAWHPNGKVLAILLEEKGLYRLYLYDVENDRLEDREFFGFQKVNSLTYSKDGSSFLLSAFRNGQSDIFLYTIRSRSIDALTNDGFTDLNPIFLNNDQFIAFRSDRKDDTLRPGEKVYMHSGAFDLFIYRADQPKDQVLWRLNATNDILEYDLRPVDDDYFAVLVDPGTGLPETHLIKLDSSISFVDTSTHYRYFTRHFKVDRAPQGMTAYDIHAETGQIVRSYIRDGRYRIAVSPMEWPEQVSNVSRETSDSGINSRLTPNESISRRDAEVNIYDYEFEPEALGKHHFPTTPRIAQVVEPAQLDSIYGEDFRIPPNRVYFLTWFRDGMTATIDNVFDYPQYQPFTGTPSAGLINTGFNSLFKIGVAELMNDYRVVAGFRTDFQPIPGVSLSPNSEFFLGFIKRKDRMDVANSLYRRSQLGIIPDRFLTVRNITYEAHRKWTWPFSPVASARFSAGLRNQRQIVLAESASSINPNDILPITATNYGVLKAAYVYDDTRNRGLNLYHGTRYKVFAEFYENFDKGNSGLFTFGIDWRNYIPVHREIIWANRFAFGTSFGNELLLHYLGGVDNVFTPGFINNTPFASQENYIFQTVVTNMRGFHQNIRNGNSFTVWNSELRIPIVRYLYNRPIQNNFLASLQIVAFGDLGTAWNGLHPYSDENAINTRTITRPGYTVVLDTQREPFVAGLGAGLRMKLLGYFCRFDWAWGVEDGRVLDRVFYFSLGTDF